MHLGAWGALYAVTPEVYPTPLRGTGAAAGFGRIASIPVQLSVPPLPAADGNPFVFGTFPRSSRWPPRPPWFPEERGRAPREAVHPPAHVDAQHR